MSKVFIKNRKDQKVCVLIDKVEDQKGLAFIMHGLGGCKEEPHIKEFAKVFKDNGFTTIIFDTTNTFGESDGKYEDATVTNYYEDLEDVITWAKDQDFYEEPFVLAGSSVGGMTTTLYAENFSEKVKALAPVSAVVSGKLNIEAKKKHQPDMFKEWERTGWRITESISKPGFMKKLKWSHNEDKLKHDLLPNAGKLIMPILMVVGDKDKTTPTGHQELLQKNLPNPAEYHIIKNGPHTFQTEEHLSEIYDIFDKWIKEKVL